MAKRGYSTSTIDRNWNYLNQALQHGLRHRSIKTNPAADVLLPEKRAAKQRKSFTIEQAQRLVVEAIPADARPAMWLTGLMCGLRPGELAGLRWCLASGFTRSSSGPCNATAMRCGCWACTTKKASSSVVATAHR